VHPFHRAKPCPPESGLTSKFEMSDEKSEKRGFAIFDRRHSANTFGVRRSVSNVGFFSSRRNSTPATQTLPNGVSTTTSTTSTTTTAASAPATSSPASNGGAGNLESKSPGNSFHSGKRPVRAEKWQLLARKVLGNLDEEDFEDSSAGSKPNLT